MSIGVLKYRYALLTHDFFFRPNSFAEGIVFTILLQWQEDLTLVMLRDSYIGYMIRLTIKICVRYNGLIILYPCRRIRAITMDNQVIEKKKKIEFLGFFFHRLS